MKTRREKLLTYGLLVLLALLQYPLWMSGGNVINTWRLKQEVDTQKAGNVRLQERNLALQAEVLDLKQGQAAAEERARSELGMVKQNESFYQIIEP